MAIQLAHRLINVKEYRLMATAGILKENDRVELINGQILEMSPIGSRHAAVVDRISNVLKYYLQEKVIVRVQNPVEIDELSEPEPDVCLLKFRKDYYADQHPVPQDILLIIEVADSSLTLDREVKLPLYAKAGITEYWIVNLERNEIEAYRSPQEDIYTIREIIRRNKPIDLPNLDLTLPVKELIG